MKALNGFYAARKTNDGVRTVFIDEETMELRELSRCIARNRAEKEQAAQAEADRQAAIRQQAAKEERRRRRALRRLVKQEIKLLALGGGNRPGLVHGPGGAGIRCAGAADLPGRDLLPGR